FGGLFFSCLEIVFILNNFIPMATTERERGCNCNGKSTRCVFDVNLYKQTGNGYRCINCIDNTDGPSCERCKAGFYRQQAGDRCFPCSCNAQGSKTSQCDNNGRCTCKPGVMGDKCDRCQPGYRSLSEVGCQRRDAQSLSDCRCNPAGSAGPCDPSTGRCNCKSAIMGQNCDRCKPGYYNLHQANPAGCMQCFCYGHSTDCTSTNRYSIHRISSAFNRGAEGWRALCRDGAQDQLKWSPKYNDVYFISRANGPVYFVAPSQFLGNQMLSYGKNLSFAFRVDRGGRQPSPEDLVLEGAGMRVTAPLPTLTKTLPCGITKTYTFRLDEHPSSNWSPQLSAADFHRLLQNLTAIKIRATYGLYSTGYLDDVTLVSAQPTPGELAPWVESCTCPSGYEGQFCEKCAPGYKRESLALGPFSQCVPCNCLGGGTCDSETGECYLGDGPGISNCLSCQPGFYSLPEDPCNCRRCPCANSCSFNPETRTVICDGCPIGRTGFQGDRCELCSDGYYGDPHGVNGPAQPCRPCQCSNNVDPNAVGNCNRLTGECLKCLYNTAGFYCDRCKDGFYGNALVGNPADRCKPCNCNPAGSQSPQCRNDGHCVCQQGFEGLKCEGTPCPTCYDQVRYKVDQHLGKLREMEAAFSRISTSQPPVNSQELEYKLNEAERTIQAMLRDAQATEASDYAFRDHLFDLKNTQSQQFSRLQTVGNTVKRAEDLAGRYNDKIQNTQRLIEKTRKDLEQAKTNMRKVALPSLDLPGDSNTLTVLAQEATALADRHKQQADEIEQTAKSASAISDQAYELVRSTVQGEKGTADSIERLNDLYNTIQTTTKDLETQADQAHSQSEIVNQDALRIYNDMSTLKKFDPMLIQKELKKVKQDVADKTRQVNKRQTQFEDLQNNMKNSQMEVKDLLKDGEDAQMVADGLLARANAARTLAEKALKSGNASFYEVEDILNSLEGFHDKINNNKAEAEKALKKLPAISSAIAEANNKRKQAEASLGNAMRDAAVAKDTAKEAQATTDYVKMEAEELKADASDSFKHALDLEEDTDKLRKQLKAVEKDFEKKNKDADQDVENIQETSGAVEGAQGKAESTRTAVRNALTTINNVLEQLGKPEGIDSQRLQSLEDALKAAKSQFNNKLSPKLEDLEQAAVGQNTRILTLEENIVNIMADIANLEDIERSLPLGCYNTAPLERP
uniref:Laminin subunit gamma 2 n=1 Tax=Latimeria chalumnae TaxID=7897 RepID=H3ACQ9_LATCH